VALFSDGFVQFAAKRDSMLALAVELFDANNGYLGKKHELAVSFPLAIVDKNAWLRTP
jgi:hypothetical protein